MIDGDSNDNIFDLGVGDNIGGSGVYCSGDRERYKEEQMMELPDGYVLLFDSDSLGIKINVTEIELVQCKHCKHCVRVIIWETSYLECEHYTPKMVDETDWCCWAEKRDDENGNVER